MHRVGGSVARRVAAEYAALRERLPRLNVLGGCCGTGHRHVREIRDPWLAAEVR